MRVIPLAVAFAAAGCHVATALPPVNPCQCQEPAQVVVSTPPAPVEVVSASPVPAPVEVASPPPAVLASRFDQGAHVEVSFSGTWYDATVVSVVGPDRWEISYDGYSSDWNQIVGPERIRPRQPSQPELEAGRAVRSVRELQEGMTVLVLYGETWYPALIRGFAPDRQVRISYVGYGPEWDETVTLERLRMPA
jgi:hypothetical protein